MAKCEHCECDCHANSNQNEHSDCNTNCNCECGNCGEKEPSIEDETHQFD